ncbi:hypothetical protein B296_00017390 [Ensete ventricosum]|uniref:Uncharacterized protein n=1 Tax=Ensete ventricosum TaxID=4639 RepID=A0A426ZPE0_ENSVE|nr:hypothetical protein B296_00017390 [Ensete ventricosum]
MVQSIIPLIPQASPLPQLASQAAPSRAPPLALHFGLFQAHTMSQSLPLQASSDSSMLDKLTREDCHPGEEPFGTKRPPTEHGASEDRPAPPNFPEPENLSFDSLFLFWAQPCQVNLRLDKVQKEFYRSKKEQGEGTPEGSPFVQEIQDKPTTGAPTRWITSLPFEPR